MSKSVSGNTNTKPTKGRAAHAGSSKTKNNANTPVVKTSSKSDVKPEKKTASPQKPAHKRTTTAPIKPQAEKKTAAVKIVARPTSYAAIEKQNGRTLLNKSPEPYRSILDAPVTETGPAKRYSDEELEEFKELITTKLEKARKEAAYWQNLMQRKDSNDASDTELGCISIDDNNTMERERSAQFASRQVTFIGHLEKALIRIHNKTYGICLKTGNLINKARLRAVPHATLSIDAKNQKDEQDKKIGRVPAYRSPVYGHEIYNYV